jgi:iron complex transport system permease protein
MIESGFRKWTIAILGLTLLLFFLLVLNLSLGSIAIPFKSIVGMLSGQVADNESWNLILRNFRLPKAITAILVGSALGVSGLQMQTLFRNPLAGPFVLGITSGAGLGVALVIFLGVYFGGFLELSGIGRSWMLTAAAGIGSFLVLLAVLFTSFRVKDGVSLLIIGLMFGTATSAIVSVLQFFSKAENIQAYVFWSFGSLGSVSWSELSILAPIIITGLLGSFLLSKPLNALLLGEDYSQSLGVNIKKVRFLIICCTSVLAGSITAFCGPIAFIGIAVPHLSRMLFNTSDHKLLTPIVIILGGSLMLLFDMLAQLPGYDATLPINSVTALLGAPFVIYLLIRKRSLNYSFKS